MNQISVQIVELYLKCPVSVPASPKSVAAQKWLDVGEYGKVHGGQARAVWGMLNSLKP